MHAPAPEMQPLPEDGLPALAVDTSGPRASVAVLLGPDAVTREASPGEQASVVLHALLEDVLHAAGVSVRDLRLLVAVRGPGSFTGLRVGLAAVSGLSLATGVAAVGVSTTAAAALASRREGAVLVVLDAGHGRAFLARHDVSGGAVATTLEAQDSTVEAALEALRACPGRGIVRGTPSRLAEMLEVADAQDAPLAEGAARLAILGLGSPGAGSQLVPLYARAPTIRGSA